MTNPLLPHDVDDLPVQANELLVAIPHMNLLKPQLAELRLETTELDRDAGLGLVRLKLDPMDDFDNKLFIPDPTPSSQVGATGRAIDLVQVLETLRNYFHREYQGWVPVLGKNRLIGNVEGANGRVIVKDDGVEPTNEKSENPWPERRVDGAGQGVRVAIADTPFSPHPWMNGGWVARSADRLWDDPPNWRAGHSTFVAGLILSQAPGAVVEANAVLNDHGSGTAWEVAKRILEIGRSRVDIINLSFACYTSDGEPPLAIATAIASLDPEIVVVAAAGNHGDAKSVVVKGKQLGDESVTVAINRRPAWPAALDGVIAVGAAKKDGVRADFSPDAPWIDVIARGDEVLSTFLTGPVVDLKPTSPDGVARGGQYTGYARWRGTSFAAALISGAIAAGVRPGYISARQSWDNLQVTLDRSRHLPAQTGEPPRVTRDPVPDVQQAPNYLPLNLL